MYTDRADGPVDGSPELARLAEGNVPPYKQYIYIYIYIYV